MKLWKYYLLLTLFVTVILSFTVYQTIKTNRFLDSIKSLQKVGGHMFFINDKDIVLAEEIAHEVDKGIHQASSLDRKYSFKEYLKQPFKFHISHDDIGDPESLRSHISGVIERIQVRCPGVVQQFLPVEFTRLTKTGIQDIVPYLGKHTAGGYMSPGFLVLLYDPTNQTKIPARTYLGSILLNNVPSYKETTNTYSWETTGDARTGIFIESNIVHELGHHMLLSLSLRSNRSTNYTSHLNELFAESFRFICYGTWKDAFRNEIRKAKIGESKKWSSHFEDLADPLKKESIEHDIRYDLGPIYHLIDYYMHIDNFDPVKIWSMVTTTIKSLKGSILTYREYDQSFQNSESIESIPYKESKALFATRTEFYQKFCKVNKCPQELEAVFNVAHEGYLKVEEEGRVVW